jgi:hypothetical protein
MDPRVPSSLKLRRGKPVFAQAAENAVASKPEDDEEERRRKKREEKKSVIPDPDPESMPSFRIQ